MLKQKLICCFLFLSTLTYGQAKVDTLRVSDLTKYTSKIKVGVHEYLVFMEDSSGKQSNVAIWSRKIETALVNGERMYLITQDWKSSEKAAQRQVISLVKRENFEPVFHYTASPFGGIQAFKFSAGVISGVDSVVNSTNKAFNLELAEPTLNWEIDLETLSILPYKNNKTFALNFYHPGSVKSKPKFYNYTVIGEKELQLYNGHVEKCWAVEIVYSSATPSKAVFYISQKTNDVLKMEEIFGKVKRYKVKLATSVLHKSAVL